MRNRWNRIGLSLCVLALSLAAVQAGQPPRKQATAVHPAVAKASKPTAAKAHKAIAHKAHMAHKWARRSRRAHARHLARLHHAKVSASVQEHVEGNVAEDALIGVHLYDNMLTLLNMFGSPDEIQPLQMAGGGISSGGFGGGGGYGGPRGSGPGASSTPGTGGAGADYEDPFGFGDQPMNFIPPGGAGAQGGPPGRRGGSGSIPPNMGPGGMPPGYNGPGARGGYGPGGPGAGGYGPGGPGGRGRGGYGPGGPAAPMGGGGAAEEATYTRWVYNRNDNKFGFVVDKSGRIIEIEAIGITNPKVKTKHGVTFGTDFATVIRRYGDPDGYDIAGDNLTLRYLVHDKVAFKLTRMGPKQPHEVTGIVVAAGKP